MKVKLIWLSMFLVFFCFSQETENQNTAVTMRGEVGIPRIIGSRMFNKSFKGIYQATFDVNFKISKNMFVGLGYYNNLFECNPKVFVKYQVPANNKTSGSISYDTRMSNNGTYIRVGYNKPMSDLIYTSFSTNVGYLFSNYTRVLKDTSDANAPFPRTNFGTLFFQPELSAHFFTEKRLSFSINLGYTTLFKKFDPKAPRFNQVQEVRNMKNNAPMSWLTLAFGFAVYIN